MTTLKSSLLAGVAMSPAERAQGRYMRNPDGHTDAAPAPAAAPEPSPAPAPAPEPELTTEQMLEQEFSGDSDPATPEPNNNGDPEPAPKPEEEKPGASVEERMAEMTAARREAEREAAENRRIAEDYKRQLDALAPPPKDGKGNDRDPDAAPSPADYDFGEADPQFIADTATFHARAEYQRQAQAAELRGQISQLEANWQGAIAAPEVVERYPDFQEKVVKAADEGKWDCSPLMSIGIKQSPVGADVAYHLATNPTEASRISRLTPIEQALEFGRIEGRFMNSPKAEEAKPTPTATNAPPPPAARARGAGGKFAVAADTEDFGAFEKSADAVLAK